MNKNSQLDEVIFESLLNTAIVECTYLVSDTYPSNEELELMENSAVHLKMLRFIRYLEYKFLLKRIYHTSMKVASIFLIIIGVTFCGFMGVEEVRASFVGSIKTVYERYTQYDNIAIEDMAIHNYKIGYLPADYSLSETMGDEGYRLLIFSNHAFQKIFIKIMQVEENSLQINHENFIIQEFYIDEWKCQMFISSEKELLNKLIMNSNGVSITIEAAISEDEMKKIAENIK